jgi:hypothetical protein
VPGTTGRHSRTLAHAYDVSLVEAIDIEAARDAWRTAAEDLGIDLQTEDCWLGGPDGRRFEVIAVVSGFGRKRGTVVLGSQHDPAISELAESQGFYCSVLSPSYAMYDRFLFEDTLNDWGWAATEPPPPWYTGESWG